MKITPFLLSLSLLAAQPVLATDHAHSAHPHADAAHHQQAHHDLIETAVAAGHFKTLAKALGAAGLVDTLKGKGPFTVFAPTDEAFAKLPKGTLEKLLQDKAQLKKILLFHVVSGQLNAAALGHQKTAKTVEGEALQIAVKGKHVSVNGAHVTQADIAASNGVIHVIDQVLIPGHKH
jgi:uncharacterized surface protein with fasciclin (FAS1) repeats